MKKAIVVLLLLLSSSFLITPTKADTVKLVSDAWCPYSCDPASEKKGILVDVAEHIFSLSGHSIDYSDLNWARAIKSVREGKYDGVIDAYKSDAPDFIFHDAPILISKMCFFVKQGDPWQYDGTKSLKGRKVSIINGYSYGELFDDYIHKNHNQGERTIVQLSGMNVTKKRIRQIQNDRTDTVLEDWKVFPYKVSHFEKHNEDSGVLEFKNAGCLAGEGLYIAFSPIQSSSEYYADLISQGLKQMQESGELTEIIRRYE
ncbi:substrate-binding periplasmic protein [Vibrio marisflavi]|uniref:Solute-binding protein family 3/N-terminal domain-containing protein n=1 Tax=Vibrio marisflavi CECT 7928 TaxID=634439 RepID=A0ABM9A3N2_9VIBR|nr:transporter substrate-binding domain-containing protein [Vibrio marisflavi]CAH0539257.1 hypothetical protein VMF7928_02025 [Vibrio marisflavi CECT 7928]